MSIKITTLAERPELAKHLYDFAAWPEFMLHDPVANALMSPLHELFADQCVVATENDELVAHGLSIPFAFPTERRTELPDNGWDAVLTWGMLDHSRGTETTASSALGILIRPSHRGSGLSHQILAAMSDAVRAKGHAALYAPVRPTGKTDPNQQMSMYAAEVRPSDGQPVDPWLRVHVRAGGTIVKVAPTSTVVLGTLAEWRKWTGLPFDTDGPVHVPEALVPVHCDVTHDHAVYVEPSVWVHHNLT